MSPITFLGGRAPLPRCVPRLSSSSGGFSQFCFSAVCLYLVGRGAAATHPRNRRSTVRRGLRFGFKGQRQGGDEDLFVEGSVVFRRFLWFSVGGKKGGKEIFRGHHLFLSDLEKRRQRTHDCD